MSREQYVGVARVVPDQDLAPLTEDKMRLLFSSGWRFNPGALTWHKLFVADDGSPETPKFLADLLDS